MSYPHPFVAHSDQERWLVEQARAAAAAAAPHAARHDRAGTFPEEGLAALAESGALAATIPVDLGGAGATIAGVALASLELAKGDASLGLVVAMHHAFLGRVRDASLWPEEVFASVGRQVAQARAGRGALINSLATEPALGSPSRGGVPGTRAVLGSDGWRVNGRKSFSSGAPVLRWGVVSANAGTPDAPDVANFLVALDAPGVRVEPTWDTLGMRATGSHTLVLEDVLVPAEARLPRMEAGGPTTSALPYERAWSLCVAAVYLGVAEAARDEAIRFARERRPTALGGKSIASVPHVRRRAGELDQQLFAARGLLVSTARAWDDSADQQRAHMEAAFAVAKLVATNTAVAVAEGAMRLVGGVSLDRRAGAHPLERHFRDVRGGLHHPPQDDATLDRLAQEALD